MENSINLINTSTTSDNTDNKNASKEKKNLNDLPLICKVEILSFVEGQKKCLPLRLISKKFNEAVQIKLFLKAANSDEAELYKKCFIFLNKNCYNYYLNNIYPFLLDADGIFHFLNVSNEETYKKFLGYCYNELVTLKTKNNLQLKEKNFEKSFKRAVNKFLTNMIINNLKHEGYDSLYFNQLVPYPESIDIIFYIIDMMDSLIFLDLSEIVVGDEEVLYKLIEKISMKKQFTLLLKGIMLSPKLVKEIKIALDKNPNIVITIDKRYGGQMKQYGGKKMNKTNNKNKFKNIQFI